MAVGRGAARGRACVDELTFVKSIQTDQFNHGPAELLLLTGIPRTAGRPSLGSWVTYGLGSENRDLPGFIVFVSGGSLPSSGKSGWGNGFLPSVYQGVQCRTGGDPVLYLSDPEGMDRSLRRLSLDALQDLNELQADERSTAETATRIAQYELAFRMQIVVPELMDLSREPFAVLNEYGAEPGAATFANNCLLARRLVEKGVRFIQLFDWGWDFHGTEIPEKDIRDNLNRQTARAWNRPVAALDPGTWLRGCSMKPSWCGWASSAARRFARAALPAAPTSAATITRSQTPCSWRAAA